MKKYEGNCALEYSDFVLIHTRTSSIRSQRCVQGGFKAEYQIMGHETGSTLIVTCFNPGSRLKDLTLNPQMQL
ncbi:hypothetical protein ATANTOWER_020446 [Ataeniobius toweri]|uniref:Uncharacterized protein n=1 Tax=Ataeniobius toweri TaxID=208326 RepID=A0ABU7BKQ8_9TELE|nr:hypothetical protein [Ataeniobius toweri]